MKRSRLILLAWFVVLGGTAFLAACNTVEGAGEDVEAVGEEISETSRDVRD